MKRAVLACQNSNGVYNFINMAIDKNKRLIVVVLSFLLFLNILSWLAVWQLEETGLLEVIFFDVGQGDAAMVKTPENQQILIDGGPGSAILEKLAKEIPFWDKTIDLVILTHPEYDHMAGLIEVLKRYKVDNILWTGVAKDSAEYKKWQEVVGKEGAEVKIAKAGQKIIFNKKNSQDVGYLEILFPFEILAGQKMKDSNSTSIVSKLVFGSKSFLFTGDISKSGEKELVNKNIELGSDVLKVSHHGSKNSMLEDFFEKVSPKIGIISVGRENKYGHPNQEVLAALEKFGIKIFRTDKDRDIKIISDGNNFKLITNN